MPSPVELAWAAGFFDGEGSISIVRRRRRGGRPNFGLHIQAAQTVIEPLRRFQSMFGGAITQQMPQAPGRRTIWYWTAGARAGVAALKEMEPYLVVKRSQAVLAIQFQEWVERPRLRTNGHIHSLTVAEIAIAETYREELLALRLVG